MSFDAEQDACCAYESGRLPGGAGWLSRPGGLELTQHAIEVAGLIRGDRVLDLGCGSGESVKFLRASGIDAMGVDKPHNLEVANAPSGLRVDAFAEQLPFANASVDGVLAECSLSVMCDARKVLSECARVLRPGGHLIISDLYARNSMAIAAIRELKGSCVSGIIVRTDLENWLNDAGFATLCFEDHSRALREAVAHFLFAHDSIDDLWMSATRAPNSESITAAMKQVRAGYFLLIATRVAERKLENGDCNG